MATIKQAMWYPVMIIERLYVLLRYWHRYQTDDTIKIVALYRTKKLNDAIIKTKYNYSYTLKDDEVWTNTNGEFNIESAFVKVNNYGCRNKGSKWGL